MAKGNPCGGGRGEANPHSEADDPHLKEYSQLLGRPGLEEALVMGRPQRADYLGGLPRKTHVRGSHKLQEGQCKVRTTGKERRRESHRKETKMRATGKERR